MDSNYMKTTNGHASKADFADQKIWQWHAEGKTLGEIRASLKKEGWKNRRGNTFSYKNVFDRIRAGKDFTPVVTIKTTTQAGATTKQESNALLFLANLLGSRLTDDVKVAVASLWLESVTSVKTM